MRQTKVRVTASDLEELTTAVERLERLNGDSGETADLDPCSMLDALAEVYGASRRLVHTSPAEVTRPSLDDRR